MEYRDKNVGNVNTTCEVYLHVWYYAKVLNSSQSKHFIISGQAKRFVSCPTNELFGYSEHL